MSPVARGVHSIHRFLHSLRKSFLDVETTEAPLPAAAAVSELGGIEALEVVREIPPPTAAQMLHWTRALRSRVV
jgi:hypothetical protein